MPETVFLDNDPAMLEVVGDLTKGRNIEVLDKPLEAVKASKEAKKLITDLDIPGMNGASVIYHSKRENPELKAYIFTLASRELKKKRPELLTTIGLSPGEVYDKTQINRVFREVMGLDMDVKKRVPYLFPKDVDDLVEKINGAGPKAIKTSVPLHRDYVLKTLNKETESIVLLLGDSNYAKSKIIKDSFKMVTDYHGYGIGCIEVTNSYPQAIALTYRHSPHVSTFVQEDLGNFMRPARSLANQRLWKIKV